MNQTCKVCGEPAAGFHFGAFTCEGCKSFFGRSYNNLSSISECKNSGKCIIDKKNRTTCKACRLRKCYAVGMSKGGSRYGRRSNWFKIHCLLQEQQQQAVEAAGKATANGTANGFGDMAAAQQHMHQQQQRHPHLSAAHHMGVSGLLGYPSYLTSEMMQSPSPFMGGGAARHPADAAAAAAALPFFSMMNSLPSMGTPQSAFQMAPHLLFPGYHPSAAAAAAVDAYRSEMFKHRQSVDSAASGESQRYSPAERSHSSYDNEERERNSFQARQSPEVCVSGDEKTELKPQSSFSPVTAGHQIHSPIAIRPAAVVLSPAPTHATHSASSQHSLQSFHCTEGERETETEVEGEAEVEIEHETEAQTEAHPPGPTASVPLSFAAKMQSLSPVSVCSIGAETAAANAQECPMDLSMKASRSSVHSFNTSAGESDVQSDSSEEELRHAAMRRKFYNLSSEHESDASSNASSEAAVKRQKLAEDGAAQRYNAFGHSATSLRGIFVCV